MSSFRTLEPGWGAARGAKFQTPLGTQVAAAAAETHSEAFGLLSHASHVDGTRCSTLQARAPCPGGAWKAARTDIERSWSATSEFIPAVASITSLLRAFSHPIIHTSFISLPSPPPNPKCILNQLMAVVEMTLGQQNRMYNVIQHSAPQSNCVIVSSGIATQPAKSVITSKRPLAPVPERTTSVLVSSNADLRCKRKIQFMPYGVPQQPASVARRNARERNRVKQVNNGFATLRQHIPSSIAAAFSPPGASSQGRGASKKLSKVETLRLAVEYIRSLQQMIQVHETESGGSLMASDSSSTTSMSEKKYNNAQLYGAYPILISTPACSEASASPTPSSHGSESSYSAASAYNTIQYHHPDNYENYDPKGSEDDEELLDAIFSWQEQ